MTKDKFEHLLNDYKQAIIYMNALYKLTLINEKAIKEIKRINLEISDLETQLLSVFNFLPTPI